MYQTLSNPINGIFTYHINWCRISAIDSNIIQHSDPRTFEVPCFHQKMNGTESQRTPDQVSCDRAIRCSGFFGVRSGTVLLEISWNVSSGIMSSKWGGRNNESKCVYKCETSGPMQGHPRKSPWYFIQLFLAFLYQAAAKYRNYGNQLFEQFPPTSCGFSDF